MKKIEAQNLQFEFLMSQSVFKFKRFSIRQSQAAMKVGTDGVLLGAWTTAENPKRILDIGSGTGLIGLLLAQRFPYAEITGIEIDKNAWMETEFNFAESPFSNRCKAVYSSLQNFKTDEKFDLIVSNPPFFKLTHSENSSRNIARQQLSLNFEDLLNYSEKLLHAKGNCAFILPFEAEEKFTHIAESVDLFPTKITRVKGNESAEYKRSLLLFSREKSTVFRNDLIVETARNVYTDDYIQLTKEFYLKM